MTAHPGGIVIFCLLAPPVGCCDPLSTGDASSSRTLLLENGTVSLEVDLNSKYGLPGLVARLSMILGSGIHRESTDNTVVNSVFHWPPHQWKIYSSDGWELTVRLHNSMIPGNSSFLASNGHPVD